jgi:hypothetical protein
MPVQRGSNIQRACHDQPTPETPKALGTRSPFSTPIFLGGGYPWVLRVVILQQSDTVHSSIKMQSPLVTLIHRTQFLHFQVQIYTVNKPCRPVLHGRSAMSRETTSPVNELEHRLLASSEGYRRAEI